MQTEPNQRTEDTSKQEEKYVPVSGFVNINEIVRKRRELRNAEFNVPDASWDAELNPQVKDQSEGEGK